MREYEIYPFAVLNVNEQPTGEQVINSLLNQDIIPLVIITDRDNETFKSIEATSPKSREVLYVIITIKYLKTFEA